MGLGHMRRNSLIAQSLAKVLPKGAVLVVAGACEASAFARPPNVDCLTLPSLNKARDGRYEPRTLGTSLEELVALRSKIILAAMEAFQPDVLIVDNVPRGAMGELDATLKYLRWRGNTRCVLGLRDILDDPVVVRREWRLADNEDVVRDYYDAVWVYGDAKVFDVVKEYKFCPEVADKLQYTGYLDYRARLQFADGEGAELLQALTKSGVRFVLCMVGGGQDGAQLASVFAESDFSPEMEGVVLMGPYMPRDDRHRLLSRMQSRPNFRALDFVTDSDLLLSCAERVVTMGGYNSVYEVLCYEKHGLIVPRLQPRREQLIRAQRLRDLGLIDTLHPEQLTPAAISQWLARDLGPPLCSHRRIDLNGLKRLPRLLERIVNSNELGLEEVAHVTS